VLALIYLALTAKPISLRRLLVLFTAVFVWANFMLALAHAAHAPQLALRIATSIALLVWSAPLARALYDMIPFRKLQLDALQSVSGFIRWTYGLCLVALPMLFVCILLGPDYRINLATLLQVLTLAILIAAVLPGVLLGWSQRAKGPLRHRVR
jgi:hypothetical protein